MAKVDKLLGKWLDDPPTEAPKEKVIAIIKRFFPETWQEKPGSHIVIQHDLLKGVPGYGPAGDFDIPVKGGQRVKGQYLIKTGADHKVAAGDEYMNKDLEYYMGLPYKIEVVPIPKSLGGGFGARLPEIGEFAITGDGETPEAAIRNLEEAKRDRFEENLRQGIEIPEPVGEEEDVSGRFVLRIPKALHRRLAQEARKNQTSLNQYVTYLLSTNFQEDKHRRYLKDVVKELEGLRDGMWNMGMSNRLYQIESSSVADKLGPKNAKVIQFPQPKAA